MAGLPAAPANLAALCAVPSEACGLACVPAYQPCEVEGDNDVNCAGYSPCDVMLKSCDSCAGLVLDAGATPEVCGTSFNEPKSACLGGGGTGALRNWGEALGLCLEMGARLCTAAEIRAGELRSSGCGRDGKQVWSGTPCMAGSNPGFYTVTGRGGETPQCLARDTGRAYPRCCADASAQSCAAAPAPTPSPTDAVTPSPTEQWYPCSWLGLTVKDGHCFRAYTNRGVCMGGAGDPEGSGRMVTYAEAQDACETEAMRVCSYAELSAGWASEANCGGDAQQFWTRDGCAGGHYTQHAAKGGDASTRQCNADNGLAKVRCCSDNSILPSLGGR